MSIILLSYSLLLITIVAAIYFLIKFTLKGSLKWKEWLFIIIGSLMVGVSYTAITQGMTINERVNAEFQVPKDFYSDWVQDSVNNPVSDKLLYQHLLTMRAPHAKIILAQAKLESNNFSSDLFKRQRNFIGMKNPRTRVTTSNQSKGEYKSYDDWQECATDYLFWMFSHNVDKLSDDEYFKYLGKIYAEDPNYIPKLKKIISQTNFSELEK
jgi:hypothetical protein